MHDSTQPRQAGILLHAASLPSTRLDDDALRWLDFLNAAGIGIWQLLPLVIPDAHSSPYQSPSAFAIDPGLLGPEQPFNESDFETFCGTQAHWLDDFALFQILRHQLDGLPWYQWPERYRHRDPHALRALTDSHSQSLVRIKEAQFRADGAWHRVRKHAADLGIRLFGDIPIFIAHNSADAWSMPHQFLLDHEGQPTFVTGVPPDYFSETGQRWGNPHYRWDTMQERGFDWWTDRMRRQSELFDLVRIDHFRGLAAVWMIAAECTTAIDGFWQETPGDALLTVLRETLPELSLVAEDLGVITDDVRDLRRKHGLPGMSVLQFAFDHFDDNPHKPANIGQDNVVYTGTHDNDTAEGWFRQLSDDDRNLVFHILATEPRGEIADLLIETAMATDAGIAITPLQDYLGLGSEARLNTPGTSEGNWHWQFDWNMLDDNLAGRIRDLTQRHGRCHGE